MQGEGLVSWLKFNRTEQEQTQAVFGFLNSAPRTTPRDASEPGACPAGLRQQSIEFLTRSEVDLKWMLAN